MTGIRRGLLWCKDLLFPKFCVGCDRENSWLCLNCLPQHINSENFSFTTDSALSVLDGLTALGTYEDNTISELVRLLKYRYITEILNELHHIILAAHFSVQLDNFVLMPVPLHPRRERERGFNQAERIANLFANRLGLEVDKSLRRCVYTAQQATLSGEERRKNLNGAFIIEGEAKVPQKVLLVDDVFTTGSTLKECAIVLKNAGVQTVWGLVLAKG